MTKEQTLTAKDAYKYTCLLNFALIFTKKLYNLVYFITQTTKLKLLLYNNRLFLLQTLLNFNLN